MAGKNALLLGTLTFLANLQKSAFAPTDGFCGEGKLIQSAGSVTWFVHILIGVSAASDSFCHAVKTVEFKKGLADPLTRTTALMLQPCIEGTLSFLLPVPCRAKRFVGFRRGPPGRG